MGEKMTSGEIAKKVGVSQKAVRLYDEKGLLKPTDYSEGNYRLYDKEALGVLEKIVALKQIGFSLEEIKDNLEAGETQDIRGVLQKQLKIMEQKQHQINKVIDMIRGTLERNPGELDWDDISYIVQSIDLNQKADENHWDALKHTGQEEDWYVKIFKSLELKEKETVLDLGCGYAKLWRNNWSEIPQNTELSCYDLHGTWADDFEEFVRENEGGLPDSVKVSVRFADIEDESTWKMIGEEKYSCIIAHYVSYVLKDCDSFFERVGKVLCKSGRFSVNGAEISSWNYFFREVLQNTGMEHGFIDACIKNQSAERDVLMKLLQKHFPKVESVIMPNFRHYTAAEELYQKLLELYPQAKKYIGDYESKIKDYLRQQIADKGEVVVPLESEFWHCSKGE